MRAARSRWGKANFCRGTFRAQIRQTTGACLAFWFNHFGSIILRPRIPEAIRNVAARKTVMPRAGGASSTPRPADSITAAFGYWVRLRSLSYGAQVARCCFFRHCERSEAIHLSVQEVTMDCFASLAMTVDTVSPARDALRLRFAEIPFPPTRGRREDRVRAAPAVSCAMCTRKCAHEHTGPAESIRPSLRDGLTAYAELSPETNSFCLRHRRIDGFANPVGLAKTSADLTPATGARTTRFCRTQLPSPNHSTGLCGRPKFWRRRLSAVRLHAVDRSRKTALRTCLRAQRCRVHRTPSQRFVTIAIRPS